MLFHITCLNDTDYYDVLIEVEKGKLLKDHSVILKACLPILNPS